MNYWQYILSSNYQHIVYKIVFIKFQQTVAIVMWCFSCLQGRSEHQWYSHRLNHYSCMEQWGVLTCLDYCAYIMFVVVLLLLADLGLVVICLFLCSWHLVVVDYYHCLVDNQQQLCIKVEAGSLPLGWSTCRDCMVIISGVTQTYTYVLYLKCKDTKFPFCAVHLSLPLLLANDLTVSHSIDNNKCITANGQTIINVGTHDICHVAIIHFMQKLLAMLWSHNVHIYASRWWHIMDRQ